MIKRIKGLAQSVLETLYTGVRSEDGQSFVEYALLITFIAIVALVAIKVLGTSISSIFSSVAGDI